MDDCAMIWELISRSMDEQLSADEQARLDSHFEQCDTCRVVSEELRLTHEVLAEEGEISPPSGFTQRVMTQIAQQERAKATRSRRMPLRSWGALAACAVLVVGLVGGQRWLAEKRAAETPQRGVPTAMTLDPITTAPASIQPEQVVTPELQEMLELKFERGVARIYCLYNDTQADMELPYVVLDGGDTVALLDEEQEAALIDARAQLPFEVLDIAEEGAVFLLLPK